MIKAINFIKILTFHFASGRIKKSVNFGIKAIMHKIQTAVNSYKKFKANHGFHFKNN